MIKRQVFSIIIKRLQEPRHFIQVLTGPRQVGKTTLAHQVGDALGIPLHYASADDLTTHDRVWIEQQWEIGRLRSKPENSAHGALLILDEVQKIPNWSETIKRLWDEDTRIQRPLKVILLGSAPLLIQQGLSETLAGRFESIPISHWSLHEMQEAFGWTLEQYIYFGGYPGAASLIHDEIRWKRYMIDSLIETTISRDILLTASIHKPALLKRLFYLGCEYSGQILSFQKMVGQLQDAGNTTTLAHYLELLFGVGMLTGLPKFAGQRVRQRASSPKLNVLNTGLISALSPLSFEAAQQDREFWGRLLESAVGAYLINSTQGTDIEISYWRENNKEVDFIIQSGKQLVAIEVKSGRRKEALPGIDAFNQAFKPQRVLLVDTRGISPEEFLKIPLKDWLAP
jgi:uncharacterized protein